MDGELIDRREYEAARMQLGASFGRILGYFREDGMKSVEQAETAMRERNAAALVVPVHRLKGESRQFGSIALGDLAERIEMGARRCVELRIGPEDMIADVVALRDCFRRTLEALEGDTTPVITLPKQAGFGRRAAGGTLQGLTRG